jgi:hypothetical protein
MTSQNMLQNASSKQMYLHNSSYRNGTSQSRSTSDLPAQQLKQPAEHQQLTIS